jgi:riboflavin-specific deaminase-like protein
MELYQGRDWDRDTALWPMALSAARGEPQPSTLGSTSLWRVYGPLIRAAAEDLPLVIGQLGQSLDGRIATPTGESRYINGQAALIHLHRVRALVDAVVVGVGTAIADDPQLTVRHAEGKQPVRVVIDPSGRLPSSSCCLRDDGVARIVISADDARPACHPSGVEQIQVPTVDGRMSPRAIVSALHTRGLRRILIEGGAVTLSAFLAAGALDRLHLLVAPMIIGSGQTGIQLPDIDLLDAALRPRISALALPGGDVLFDCAFGPQDRGSA